MPAPPPWSPVSAALEQLARLPEKRDARRRERLIATHDGLVNSRGLGKGDGLGIEAHLAKSAAGVRRLTPKETVAAARRGALVVDTRTETQRQQQGELPGAVVIDRTVLEWRLDPASGACIPEATDYDIEIVVVCRQGYSSILAAASLRAVGLWRSTDMIGGVEAWQAAGLPLTTGPADVRP